MPTASVNQQPTTSNGISLAPRTSKNVAVLKNMLNAPARSEGNSMNRQISAKLMQDMKEEFNKILSNQKNKNTEMVTPRIQSVYTEATQQPSVSNRGDVVIDVDREDILKKITKNSAITLMPKTSNKDPLGTGKECVCLPRA